MKPIKIISTGLLLTLICGSSFADVTIDKESRASDATIDDQAIDKKVEDYIQRLKDSTQDNRVKDEGSPLVSAKEKVDLYSETVNDESTDYKYVKNHKKQELVEMLNQGNKVEDDFNALADAMEHDPEGVLDEIAETNLIDETNSAITWLLMKGFEAQIDYIELNMKISDNKELTESESKVVDGVLISLNGLFAYIGAVKLASPGLIASLRSSLNFIHNRHYRYLVSKKLRLQGKIESLRRTLNNIERVSKMTPEQVRALRDLFPKNQKVGTKSFHRLIDPEYHMKSRNEMAKLIRKSRALDKQIKLNTPVPRVSNIRSKAKRVLRTGTLTAGFIAGMEVFKVTTSSAGAILLETKESSDPLVYYRLLQDIHKSLSEYYTELTQY